MASLSRRFANLLSTQFPAALKWGTRRQIKQFRASNGLMGNKMMGKPAFLLDVISNGADLCYRATRRF